MSRLYQIGALSELPEGTGEAASAATDLAEALPGIPTWEIDQRGRLILGKAIQVTDEAGRLIENARGRVEGAVRMAASYGEGIALAAMATAVPYGTICAAAYKAGKAIYKLFAGLGNTPPRPPLPKPTVLGVAVPLLNDPQKFLDYPLAGATILDDPDAARARMTDVRAFDLLQTAQYDFWKVACRNAASAVRTGRRAPPSVIKFLANVRLDKFLVDPGTGRPNPDWLNDVRDLQGYAMMQGKVQGVKVLEQASVYYYLHRYHEYIRRYRNTAIVQAMEDDGRARRYGGQTGGFQAHQLIWDTFFEQFRWDVLAKNAILPKRTGWEPSGAAQETDPVVRYDFDRFTAPRGPTVRHAMLADYPDKDWQERGGGKAPPRHRPANSVQLEAVISGYRVAVHFPTILLAGPLENGDRVRTAMQIVPTLRQAVAELYLLAGRDPPSREERATIDAAALASAPDPSPNERAAISTSALKRAANLLRARQGSPPTPQQQVEQKVEQQIAAQIRQQTEPPPVQAGMGGGGAIAAVVAIGIGAWALSKR